LINRRANSHEKNKSSIDFRTAQKTECWCKNWNWTLLHLKIAQRTMLFQRSTAFLIKSLSVLSFLNVQDNKLRSVITILSEMINNEIYLYEMLTTNFLQAMLVRRAEQSHQQRSAMKLICTWCWLWIYCLATVESKDYQKFEWYQDAAWWWSAVRWSRAEFSRLRKLQ